MRERERERKRNKERGRESMRGIEKESGDIIGKE